MFYVHCRCKRCSAIEAYDIALATTMKPKHFKRMVAGHIKSNKNSAVLAMVDLTDLTNETIPNLLQDTVHKNSQIILLGNKFDLFPPVSDVLGAYLMKLYGSFIDTRKRLLCKYMWW